MIYFENFFSFSVLKDLNSTEAKMGVSVYWINDP